MRLSDALRIDSPGSTVAFTGAGGKSALIGRLSLELAERFPVVVTTTTKLGLHQSDLGREHVIARAPGDLQDLADRLEESRVVLVTGGEAPGEPKWMGPDAATLSVARDILAAEGGILVIEADGARGRSLKAPADHEPVVPPFADRVVPVAGLQALGKPLSAQTTHRPELASARMALAEGETVEAYHIARLLGHPQGGLKGAPSQAEVRVVLNQADSEETARSGEIIGQMLLGTTRIRASVVTSMLPVPRVEALVGRVAGIVLAAGGSARLGQSKQLLRWRGEPLVWHAVRAALDGGLSPVVVVTGDQAQAVAAAVETEDVQVVGNPAWRDGQSTSVRAGLAAVEDQVEAAVFLLSDTPFVDASLVRALVEAHRIEMPAIVAPRAGGRWANPVLFDRVTFPAFATLEGDRGGRALFDHFSMRAIDADPRILADIDTPDDLQALIPPP